MNMRKCDLKLLIKEIVTTALREMNLRGEWWFQDGQAVFADGDSGDMNHEAYVVDSLKRDILDSLGVDTGGDVYAPNFYEVSDEIFENIKDELTPEQQQRWMEGSNADIEEILKEYFQAQNDAENLEKFSYMNSPTLDPREYALKHWGWQRVKGNVIQTQTMTERDIRNITDGLWEAYGNELEEDPNTTFEIEVMATRSYYVDVPWVVLQKDSTTALNPYRTRY